MGPNVKSAMNKILLHNFFSSAGRVNKYDQSKAVS